jgi:hypothetical protein
LNAKVDSPVSGEPAQNGLGIDMAVSDPKRHPGLSRFAQEHAGVVDEVAMNRVIARPFLERTAQACGVTPELARPRAGNQTELHRFDRLPPGRVHAGGEEIELKG